MPERGASPFPTIEADGYRSYSSGIRGKGVEGDTMQVDWDRLKKEIKPMQEQLGREHIAFYSQYDPDSQQYTYSPHGLIFSDEAVARADGKSGLILYEIRDAENKHLNKVVLIHAPISRQAIDEMRIWARGGGSSPAQQNARTSFMSNSIDGGSGFDCGDYASWVDGIGCVHDEEMIVTPEGDWMDDPFFNPESLEEEDGSGGFYPPQPEDTECHVFYGCGGGVGGGNNGDDEESDIPCVGNPVQNPRIAPQNHSGINGGRFGYTRTNRDGSPRHHSGLDIKADYGESLFAMYGGTVVNGVGYNDDLGHFVTIQVTINGNYYTIQYAHLKEAGRAEHGSTISAGDVIGVQGTSGILDRAIRQGHAVSHAHIIVRKRIGDGWDLEKDYSDEINPEIILTTEFDDNGNPINETDC